MKKVFVLVLFAFLPLAFLHAYSFVQFDANPYGLYREKYHDSFDRLSPDSVDEICMPAGCNVSVFEEFNSDDGKRLHYFIGGDFGLPGIGFSLTVNGGLYFQLFTSRYCSFELCSGLRLGPAIHALSGVPFLFVSPYADFIVMPKSRKGFYAGVGVIQFTEWSGAYYKDLGWETALITFYGSHAVLGFRVNVE